MAKDIQPVFILPEGTSKTSGRTAQKLNIEAAKLVAEQVRTTLGPKGMDKMIVDAMGDVTITNDGVTILEQMNIEHPTAKMIVEIAKTQEDEVGDGTTTAVILAGELLKNAEQLLEQNVHPTIIAKGFRLAAEKANLVLPSLAKDVTLQDKQILKHIAMTAMTGKSAEAAKELLASMLYEAVQSVAETKNGIVDVDVSNIKLEKKVGAGIEGTELVKGIVLDKEKVHSGMPAQVMNAKIALLDCAIEVKDTEIDAKISITDPSQMQAFIDQEEKMIRDKVNAIVNSGANVVFCQKGIDDLAQFFLSKAGVYACRRLSASDLEKLAKSTGAKIVNNVKELTSESLGNAGVVEQAKVGDEDMTFVRECPNPKAVTILVRGGTEHVAEEAQRAMEDALGDLRAALSVGKVVGGAGAIEIKLAKELRLYANSLSGKEQLAVESFATAVEAIPRTLAESAGLDPIDKLAEMKAALDSGMEWAGINVFDGRVIDSWTNMIVEPLKVKTQAVKSASEAAIMILRIDDVILGGSAPSGGPPPGMPPGMGGMGMM